MRLRFLITVGLLATMKGWADDKLPLLKAGSGQNLEVITRAARRVESFGFQQHANRFAGAVVFGLGRRRRVDQLGAVAHAERGNGPEGPLMVTEL